MERTETGLMKAIDLIRSLRAEFWRNCPGAQVSDTLGTEAWRKAGRVADFLRLGELSVHRRAAPPQILRWPLPRGEPDRGRQAFAARRPVPLCRRLGIPGSGDGGGMAAHPPRGTARLTPSPEAAQLITRGPLTLNDTNHPGRTSSA